MAKRGAGRSPETGAPRKAKSRRAPGPESPPPAPSPGDDAGAAATPQITITVQQQQQQGPWYTCGLGGGLRTEHAVLFGALVALSYAVGLWVLFWIAMALVLQSAAEASRVACTCGVGAGAGGGGSGGGCCDPCCDGCCGSSNETSGGGSSGGQDTPGPGVAATAGVFAASALARRLGFRLPSLAHHPHHPDFRADVFTAAGVRLCVGCFTVYPLFLAASAAIAVAQPGGAWWGWLAAGAAAAAVQGVSSAGWARRRSAKVAVKAALGLGLAAAVHGILAAPWPNLAQAVALAALLGLGALSALPRRRRLAAWHRARAGGPS